MRQGREFTPEDINGKERIAIINETMARFYFGNRSPLDQFLRLDDSVAIRIVGVVADMKVTSLETAPDRRYYLPYRIDSAGGPQALRFQIRDERLPGGDGQARS